MAWLFAALPTITDAAADRLEPERPGEVRQHHRYGFPPIWRDSRRSSSVKNAWNMTSGDSLIPSLRVRSLPASSTGGSLEPRRAGRNLWRPSARTACTALPEFSDHPSSSKRLPSLVGAGPCPSGRDNRWWKGERYCESVEGLELNSVPATPVDIERRKAALDCGCRRHGLFTRRRVTHPILAG